MTTEESLHDDIWNNDGNNITYLEQLQEKEMQFMKPLMCVYIVVGTAAVCSNIPILFVAYKTKRFASLAFLAAADLVYGMAFITSGPVRLVYMFHGWYYLQVSPIWCMLTPWFYCFHLGFVWPSLGVALVALERAVALLRPLWYKAHWHADVEMNIIKAAGIVVTCFFVPAPVACVLGHLSGKTVPLQCSATAASSKTLPFVDNIFGIILGNVVCVTSCVSYVIGVRRMKRTGVLAQDRVTEREKRLTKAIGIVVLLTFFLNIVPVTIQLLDSNKRHGFIPLPEKISRVFLVQVCLNSVVNLYIYLIFNSRFRKSLHKYLSAQLVCFSSQSNTGELRRNTEITLAQQRTGQLQCRTPRAPINRRSAQMNHMQYSSLLTHEKSSAL